MTVFWMIVAVMVALSLAFVLPPLLGSNRRSTASPNQGVDRQLHREHWLELQSELQRGELSPERFEEAKNDISRALLEDLSAPPPESISAATTNKTPAIILAVTIPLASVGLYLRLGSTESVSPSVAPMAASVDGQPGSVEEMVQGLAERLRNNPDDAQGWLLLARTYVVLERYPQARDAYARAYALSGDEPQLMADYAEAIALTQDNRLTGEPAALLERVLRLEPNNQKGLWLSGFAARQSGNNRQAVVLWQQLLTVLTPGSEEIGMVRDMIAQAGGEQAVAATGAEKDAEVAASLEVHVSLDPALESQVGGEETLFVFARALDGPPMPLAIQRLTAGELPLTVTLDDTMNMLPAFKLSSFPTVTVGARVSRTGNATPASGDLQGLVSPIVVSETDAIELIISEVVE